jgi:hypothetical protein
MPARWGELWGIGWAGSEPSNGAMPEVDLAGEEHRYTSPTTHPEALQTTDAQRCIETQTDPELLLTNAFVAFELGRVAFMALGAGIIERIVTTLPVVDAISADGTVLFTLTNLDGQDPCLSELVHPTPGGPELRWRWRLLARGLPNGGPNPVVAPLGPVFASPGGADLIPPWDDLRYGTATQWGDHQQVVVTGRVLVSLWLELRLVPAPTPLVGGWAVRAGGRLQSYFSRAGRLGVALEHATKRIR